ncbi:MAG: hypothetical protein KW802_01185 [Candidatus Doudnabacteria bacterium]|nr:hypothetical protein [Candidatus Doudnabacteria bacterium]
MYQTAQSIYYSLAIFVLAAAFFVMQPSNNQELVAWQSDIVQQLTVASKQTMGDRPWFSDLADVYDGINNFYDEAANATIALFSQPETDEDIIYVFNNVYTSFLQSFREGAMTPKVAGLSISQVQTMPQDFMKEEPLYNIIPYRDVVRTVNDASNTLTSDPINPVNSPAQPWVTVQDNTTGQLYCLAVYNDTVNKYLGACRDDNYQ